MPRTAVGSPPSMMLARSTSWTRRSQAHPGADARGIRRVAGGRDELRVVHECACRDHGRVEAFEQAAGHRDAASLGAADDLRASSPVRPRRASRRGRDGPAPGRRGRGRSAPRWRPRSRPRRRRTDRRVRGTIRRRTARRGPRPTSSRPSTTRASVVDGDCAITRACSEPIAPAPTSRIRGAALMPRPRSTRRRR